MSVKATPLDAHTIVRDAIMNYVNGDLDVKLNKKIWIITSNGQSQDALPINFVSKELVGIVKQELKHKWYMPKFE